MSSPPRCWREHKMLPRVTSPHQQNQPNKPTPSLTLPLSLSSLHTPKSVESRNLLRRSTTPLPSPMPPPPTTFHLLLRLASRLLSLLRCLSFVALRDLHLSLSFLLAGLFPVTLDLDASTTVHLWIPTHRRHRRTPLVLIHGFGGNSKWQWHRQIAPLSSSFDLYVPDLLFFGKSRSDTSDRTVEFQAKCVLEALRRLGVERFAVCGISYGGFVAFRMAEMAAEEVSKVVILTAGVCATEEQKRELVESEERDVYEVFLPKRADDLTALMRRSMFRPPKWMPAFLLRDFIQVMYKDYRNERVELLRELLQNGAGVHPLPVLCQDTLIIWGNRDKVFPLHLAHQLKSHLGQNSTLHIVEDAGHACQLEQADIVNRLIQSFVFYSKCSMVTIEDELK